MPEPIWRRAAILFVLRAYRLGFPQVEEGNRKGEVCKSRFKEAVAALCVVRSLITIQKLFGSFKGDAFK